MQNWPRGPSSLHELFLWPETYAKKLLDLPGATQNAQALMQYEFVLNDAYSGMGTGSYAFHLAAKHTARTYGITNRFSFFLFMPNQTSCLILLGVPWLDTAAATQALCNVQLPK